MMNAEDLDAAPYLFSESLYEPGGETEDVT